MDQELYVLPSGVTTIRQAMGQTYYIVLLIFWSGWGRWAGNGEMDVLFGEQTTEWVGVCGQGTGLCVII